MESTTKLKGSGQFGTVRPKTAVNFRVNGRIREMVLGPSSPLKCLSEATQAEVGEIHANGFDYTNVCNFNSFVPIEFETNSDCLSPVTGYKETLATAAPVPILRRPPLNRGHRFFHRPSITRKPSEAESFRFGETFLRIGRFYAGTRPGPVNFFFAGNSTAGSSLSKTSFSHSPLPFELRNSQRAAASQPASQPASILA
ncbi:hypothetical protein K0M31_003087 [Melipona bicolor]|uniref:Uncharacterized protein n=1 Tax=Melipona bicolor TaxID=60889 RepID=A0AA40G0T0_9HYME|nr:hypothetical protein K0M31_003087 [Melipona bicolor]